LAGWAANSVESHSVEPLATSSATNASRRIAEKCVPIIGSLTIESQGIKVTPDASLTQALL
jgi:hypothetical protein